jgi:transcriptional antiterminator NusG
VNVEPNSSSTPTNLTQDEMTSIPLPAQPAPENQSGGPHPAAQRPAPDDVSPPPVITESSDSPQRASEVAPSVGPFSEPVAAEHPASEIGPQEPEAEDVEIEDEPDLPFAPPLEFIDETTADEDLSFDWFILKVQVNREDSIKDALLRRVKMNGLERYFREIVVPTEDVVEFTKTGKRRVVKKKLYPGYILVNMSVTDESWFMVRETSGIGDFTGSAGKPTPMDPKDVERILRSSKVLPDDEEGPAMKTAIPFKQGDRVRVKEGYFQNFEGDVDAIDQATGRVTVMINIFGRSTPVELVHWQIEAV